MSNQNYRLEENDIEKFDSRLLYITKANYDSDWHSLPHTHHFTELFFVIRGKGEFLVETKTFPVTENTLIIVNPNISHTEYGVSGTPMEYVVLGINGLQFQSDMEGQPTSHSIHNFSSYSEEINFYLRILLKEMKFKETNFESICQNLLEILIWSIVRRTKTDLALAPTKRITKECHFIEQYLNDHFREDISLQTLSDLTYMNKYYLVHAFKNYKGTSPINYLIDKRIAEAKHLLATTNYPVAKIASLSGFSSQSYFSQIFRKETDMTPNQYRKTMEKSTSEHEKNEPQ